MPLNLKHIGYYETGFLFDETVCPDELVHEVYVRSQSPDIAHGVEDEEVMRVIRMRYRFYEPGFRKVPYP